MKTTKVLYLGLGPQLKQQLSAERVRTKFFASQCILLISYKLYSPEMVFINVPGPQLQHQASRLLPKTAIKPRQACLDG